MASNRLRLDFSLQTTEERLKFLSEYLPTITFTPNDHETETLSDYILWGKNPQTGLNAQQEGIITLKEWAPNSNIESLESLMEIPGFQETRFQRIGGTHYRTKRYVFNREETLKKSTPEMRPIFEELFEQIDRTELIINYYDIKSGKRKTPPRTSLLKKFTTEEQLQLKEKAEHLNMRQYLKMRHHLVELRTEQYSYRDSIQTTIMPHAEVHITSNDDTFRIDEDIEVRPLGLYDNTANASNIFAWPLNPAQLTESELESINARIWHEPDPTKLTLDFEEPQHILMLYKNYHELKCDGEDDPNQIYGAAASVIRTLDFYESIARLSDLQRELLHMKIDHKTNNQIRSYINSKYHTAYNENYISTIYRQKIIPTIAQAATYHKKSVQSIFYPEDFKVCRDCGMLYLRSPEFFMRQAKSGDGFAPRCKMCQKKVVERRKKNVRIIYLPANPTNNENATN